jgi:hypothetical protein
MHEEEHNANPRPPFSFLWLQSYQYMGGRGLIQTVNNYISGLPLIGMTRGKFWGEGPHFEPTFHHTHVCEDAP